MPEEVIETGVDGLIRLVNDKNKISVADAAKELNVPIKTIEQWMDFLVEEEKIGVEYKFTTPYLYKLEKEESTKKDVKDIKITKKELLDLSGVDFQKEPGNANDFENEIVDENELNMDSEHFRKINRTERNEN